MSRGLNAMSVAACAATVTVCVAGSSIASAPAPTSQVVDGVHFKLQFDDKESRWFRHHWEVWFTLDRLRLDGFTEGMDDDQTSSLFLLPDPEPRLVLMNHADRTAMTCSVSRAVAAERDHGGMADWPIVASPEGPLMVLRTSAQKAVGSWDAYELQIRKPGPAEERVRTGERMFVVRTRKLDVAALWFSADVREGRTEISELLYAVLGPYLEAGGSGIWFHSLYLRTLVGLRAHAVDDVPDLLPVQIVVSDNVGHPSAISTLHAFSVGTVDPSIFEPPEGYALSDLPGC